jgi:hypothetical protein
MHAHTAQPAVQKASCTVVKWVTFRAPAPPMWARLSVHLIVIKCGSDSESAKA